MIIDYSKASLPDYPPLSKASIKESQVVRYGTINLREYVTEYPDDPRYSKEPFIISDNYIIEPAYGEAAGIKYNLNRKVFIVIPYIGSDKHNPSQPVSRNIYYATGRHFGIFNDEKSAKRYITQLKIAFKLITKTEKLSVYKQWRPAGGPVIGEDGITYYEHPTSIVQLADIDTFDSVFSKKSAQLISGFAGAQSYFQSNITSINVTWRMDLSSSISIKFNDPNYYMLESNYFVPRRDILYRGVRYEIADVNVGPGPGGSPEIEIQICNKAIQRMKREKRRNFIGASSGYGYAQAAAQKFGLKFIGQKSARTLAKFTQKTDSSEQSVWDVLQSVASENQFVCFENEGSLVYAQQEWLLWKYGLHAVTVNDDITKKNIKKHFTPLLFIPSDSGGKQFLSNGVSKGWWKTNIQENISQLQYFQLSDYPKFSTSDNDVLAAEGSCDVLFPNGGQIRPGHTVIVGPEPSYFFGGYLVNEVSFDELNQNTVTVQFRTPEEPQNQLNKPIVPLYGTSPARKLWSSTTNLDIYRG